MLRTRLIFGPIFIAVMIGLFWLDDNLDTVILGSELAAWLGRETLPSGLLLFLFSALLLPPAAYELTQILRANDILASPFITIIAAELGLCLLYCPPNSLPGSKAAAVVCTGLVIMFIVALGFFSRKRNVEGVVAAAGGAVFAMIYLGLMLGFLLALRRWNSAWVVLSVIAITKSCDTGAYFFGRWFGRHKLIPWLSPGKTWEGLAGGVAVSTAVAILLCLWGQSVGSVEFRPGDYHDFHYPLGVAVLAGVLFGIVGHLGDLTASLFKRDAGMKDSSSLIPGFGGVLDIVDSPLLVAPVAYWLLNS